MMELLLVVFVAFGASMLTFFSGFGLGTILTPIFILFFDIEIAIAATAIVHLLNNVFKFTLIGRHVAWKVALTFGLPAILGAIAGASFLGWLSFSPADTYIDLFGLQTTALNLVLGILIIIFSLMELIPALRKLSFSHRWMVPGGLISGFFGGLSGHQGALRSAFLIKFPLTKEQFIATGIVIAMIIDVSRIGTYATSFDWHRLAPTWATIGLATIAAFCGAVIGKLLMKKMTISSLQYMVGGLMLVLGVLLALGVVN